MKDKVKKILILKLRGIGDVILSTVIFDSLRSYFPHAEIDFLTEKPGKIALENLNFLNEILIFDRASTLSRFKLLLDVRKREYDLVIDLFSNPSTAQITYFSKAEFRAGFPYKGRRYAYNLFGPFERNIFHSADLNLELIKNIGIPIVNKNLYFGLDKGIEYNINKYVKSINLNNNLLVGISPTGGWASKKCDPGKFAQIADEIAISYKAEILIIWGKGDEKDAFEIKERMRCKSTIAPETSLQELAALIKNCDFMVANDSGPMHISTALGTPVLSLHGPTNPRLQGPYGERHEFAQLSGLDCIECNLLECPRNHECFLDLPMDYIMNKIENIVNKNKIERIERN